MAIEVNIVRIFLVDKCINAVVWTLPPRDRMFIRQSLGKTFEVSPRQRIFSRGILDRTFVAIPRNRMFSSVREKG